MKVYVDTAEFQFVHGRSPRGRGTWAFYFREGDGTKSGVWIAPSNLTYGDALKLAKQEAAARNSDFIVVGS